MPLVATEHDPSTRQRVIRVYIQNGAVGLVLMIAFTLLRGSEAAAISALHGGDAPLLIALFFVFATVLALLKFPLTEEIFVSLVITADIAMMPLLGPVLSAWIAVAAAVAQRVMGTMQIGPSKTDVSDRRLETARTFALFSTYGIPVIVASLLYETLGGVFARVEPTMLTAARIALCGVLMIVTNNLIVARVEHALGYTPALSLKLGVIDSSICLISLPYAILTTFAYSAIGFGGLAAAAFTGILANASGHKLAITRADREQLIQRLSSLTNIGKTISLRCTTDELLRNIYEECRKMIDVSIFSIALYDKKNNSLCFELNIERGTLLPKTHLPLGDGLNSWVVLNGKTLVVGSNRDERKFGVTAYDDGLATESWLGVPMTSGEDIIGVISVQSYEKNAFSPDDVLLLSAIANQAAVAIENANLYKDLEALNQELEQRVHGRTNELREANVRLIAADRSKNQFLASMSHELRTPLNAIIGFSTILQQSTEQMIPPRLYRFIDNIRSAGGHLLDLINDILDLAKIESGKLELNPEAFDIRDTIATVDRVMKGIAAERNVSVITTIEPPIAEVFLDEGRIKQILLNLLSNAVKFSHDGGYVYLNVSKVPAASSPLGHESMRIEVQDSGIGIASDAVPHIFDEFYQATDGGRALKKGGTGLGLSLTKSFVELHRDSQLGVGARFTLDLPFDYRDLVASAAAAPAANAQAR
jgi:signal transduction histidine kinase